MGEKFKSTPAVWSVEVFSTSSHQPPNFAPELGARLGFEAEEWLVPGFPLGRLHPEDRADVERFWAQTASGPHSPPYHELEFRICDSRNILICLRQAVFVAPAPSAEGAVWRVTMDITLPKRAALAWQSRASLLETALESITDGVLVADAHGILVARNSRIAKIWQLPPEAVRLGTGAELLRLAAEKVEDAAAFLASLDKPSPNWEAGGCTEVRLKDGRILERYTRPHFVDGTREGIVISYRDVTEARAAEQRQKELLEAEKAARLEAEEATARAEILANDLRLSLEELQKAQEQLVQRGRMAALGELSSTIAHEVRNSLGAIFNAVSGLRRRVVLAGEVGLLLDVIKDEADRLNRLVSDLLVFARPIRGTPVYQPAADLVDAALAAALRSVDRRAEITINKTIPDDLPEVYVDFACTCLALTNIVKNAFQAMQAGGTFEVGATQRVVRDQTYVELELSDTGPGIREEVLPRVFEPFFTTKALGTGLGLSIAKRLIEEQRGELHVKAPSGRGATFVVRLPC